MNILSFDVSQSTEVQQLFIDVFSKSEGEEEGKVIGDFVLDMMNSTALADLYGFVAYEGNELIGSIFFSRMTFESSIEAFILSPVAISSKCQKQGVGQALIRHGIDQLEAEGISIVFTYGDPNYYSKVGFQSIAESQIKAPQPLSQPIGWLCQSLNGGEIPHLSDKPTCVSALNKPELW